MSTKPARSPHFCLAPWTHTYLSPLSERRLCCASREKSQFVHQYIDQPGGHGAEYKPVSLAEHWNSEHMRSVRRRMMSGESLPECEVCDEQRLSHSTYRHWFTDEIFPDLVKKAMDSTDETGATTMLPVSFDYRFDNACNFKCRMCGDQFSSSWEIENQREGAADPVRDPWKEPRTRESIKNFQRTTVETEFAEAVRSGRIRELYWVGGEPLVWSQHWKYMKELVDLGFAKNVYARYNTNLSIVENRGVRLFRDLLPHFGRYMISASIDGAGPVGEFIRSGLNWEKWLANFEEGVRASRGREETAMLFDVTLTLPGLFAMEELLDHALRLDVRMEVKLIYAFDPFVILSPLALPRETLEPLLDRLLAKLEKRATRKQEPLIRTLKGLKDRKTFQEEWPEKFRDEARQGKRYLQDIARRRGDGRDGRLSYEEIYSRDPAVLNWWESI